MSELSGFLKCAEGAARQAGAYLREQFELDFTYSPKSDHQDLVTECDHVAEELVIKHLLNAYPEHSVLAEEGGSRETSSEYCWVIDPIDGTTNFAHKIPIFAVSIALERAGQIVVAAMYDPMRDEMFTAQRGGGAHVNARPMQVSDSEVIKESLLMAGYPYNVELLEGYRSSFKAASIKSQGVRRLGSAALAMAYVAAGRIDGFWTMNVNLWDVAAGLLLIDEAGGTITRLSGEAYQLGEKSLIASNGKIHSELIEMLEE